MLSEPIEARLGPGDAALLRCIELTGDLVTQAAADDFIALVSRRLHPVAQSLDALADAGLLQGSATGWWVRMDLSQALIARLPMAWHLPLLAITGEVMCRHAADLPHFERGLRRLRVSGDAATIAETTRAWLQAMATRTGAHAQSLERQLLESHEWLRPHLRTLPAEVRRGP